MKNENAQARVRKKMRRGNVGDKGRVKRGWRARTRGGGALWRATDGTVAQKYSLHLDLALRWTCVICSYALIVLLKGDFIYYWFSFGPFYKTLGQRASSGTTGRKLPTCCLFTGTFTGRFAFLQYSKTVNLIWDLLIKLPEVSVSTFTAIVRCLTRSTRVRRRKK